MAPKINKKFNNMEAINIPKIIGILGLKASPAPILSNDKAKARKIASRLDKVLDLSISAYL